MDLGNSFRRAFLGWVGGCRLGRGIWSRAGGSSETGQERGGLDIYFCVLFGCCCRSLICGRETGSYVSALVLHFLGSLAEVIRLLVTQLVYQICYTRYQVSFYLWRIEPALKHYKSSKVLRPEL